MMVLRIYRRREWMCYVCVAYCITDCILCRRMNTIHTIHAVFSIVVVRRRPGATECFQAGLRRDFRVANVARSG